MAVSHLLVLKRPYLDAIFDGRKTIESRFMRINRAPFGKVAPGDKLFFKIVSGPVCAKGRVQKVMSFDNLTPQRMQQIKRTYNDRIVADDQYWDDKRDCKRGVLIWLNRIKPTDAVMINKKDWRAWVVLTPEADFGLLTG